MAPNQIKYTRYTIVVNTEITFDSNSHGGFIEARGYVSDFGKVKKGSAAVSNANWFISTMCPWFLLGRFFQLFIS